MTSDGGRMKVTNMDQVEVRRRKHKVKESRGKKRVKSGKGGGVSSR